jgi:O-antigen/teichoic acid export membrane protein
MSWKPAARRIPDFIRELIDPATAARSLSSGLAWAVAITGLGTVISYALHIFLARLLGSAEYGVYTFSLGWMNIAQTVASFELGTVVLRYLGEYRAAGRWSLLHGLIKRCRQIVTAAGVACGLLGAAAIFLLRSHIDPSTQTALLLTCLLVPVSSILLLDAKILQGFNRSIEARLPFTVLRPLLLGIVLAVATVLWSSTPTAAWAVGANLVATTVSVIWSAAMLRRVVANDVPPAPPAYATGEWMRTGFTFLAMSPFQLILSTQSDIVLVGSLVNTTQAGLYAAASQLAMLVVFVPSVAADVVSPRIAALYAVGDRAGLARLVHRFALACWVVSLPIFLVLVVGGQWLLEVYGKDFTDAYAVLLLLALAQLISAAVGGIGGTILSMTGHQWRAAPLIVSSAILNLLLTFWWTPMFGPIGAAWATLTAAAFRAAGLLYVVRREVHVWVRPGW